MRRLKFVIVLLFITINGCNIYEYEGLTQSEAIIKAIEEHNKSNEVISDIVFPLTIKPGEVISRKVRVGGPPPGLTLNIKLSVDAEKTGSIYNVTLIEDYNIQDYFEKETARSYYTYEVSIDDVKLIEKDESGNWVYTIK